MKNKQLLIYIFIIIFSACNHAKKEETSFLQHGFWKGILNVQNLDLPFIFKIDDNNQITVYNGKNRLKMEPYQIKNDSIIVYFSAYPTYLIFKKDSSQHIKGYFVNPDHDVSRIKFKASFLSKDEFPLFNTTTNKNISGDWKTIFRWNTDKAYPAIGHFEQKNNIINGSFLKTFGDAGYLTGTFKNDSLFLYNFNASSASIYIAQFENDTLKGNIYWSNNDTTRWIATKNDSFKLKNPYSFTTLEGDSIQLHFSSLEGKDYIFPNKKTHNKVTILQILGTWCHNCLDETNFYKELYKKYHHLGLEIIGIAYERPKEFEGQVKRIKRYINNEQIPYPILVGGCIYTNDVNEDFNMFSKITAFPTSICFDKNGKLAFIHTGFNGPSTGLYYKKYRKEMFDKIEKLLQK